MESIGDKLNKIAENTQDKGTFVNQVSNIDVDTPAPCEKVCTNCQQLLPLTNFRKQKATKDGFKYVCKACDSKRAKERYAKKKDKIIGQVRDWQEQNREKVKKYKSDFKARKKDKHETPRENPIDNPF